ncbi:14638_t:CDS:2 [Funneliformis geosporum]|nr:14638_t:CDS:2 [Funneliformis geosporum]
MFIGGNSTPQATVTGLSPQQKPPQLPSFDVAVPLPPYEYQMIPKGGTGSVTFPAPPHEYNMTLEQTALNVPLSPYEYQMTPGQTALCLSRSHIDLILSQNKENEARAVEYVASLYARLASLEGRTNSRQGGKSPKSPARDISSPLQISSNLLVKINLHLRRFYFTDFE